MLIYFLLSRKHNGSFHQRGLKTFFVRNMFFILSDIFKYKFSKRHLNSTLQTFLQI